MKEISLKRCIKQTTGRIVGVILPDGGVESNSGGG